MPKYINPHGAYLSPCGDKWTSDDPWPTTVNVGLDIDDVLCDTTVAFCLALSARVGAEITEADIIDYDWEKCPKLAAHSVTRQQCWDALTDTYHRPEFARQPSPGAVATTRQLAQMPGVHIKLITARSPAFAPLTQEWLRVHGFVWHQLIHDPNKHLHGCDVFAEDSYANAEAIANHDTDCLVFLLDRLHNKNTPLMGSRPIRHMISRVGQVAEILPYVNRLSKERNSKIWLT